MSMPGFVFHICCPECHRTSPDYPLWVFPDLFSADIVLPAWSRRFQCYCELRCCLGPTDRGALEKNPDRLREFAGQLSSAVVTVGVPLWSVEADGICVRVEPKPDCPFCGCSTEARSGFPPDKPVESVQDVSDPYAVPLSMLGMSVRALNCLLGAEIGNLGQLCERSPEELLAIPQFGVSTLQEVRDKVEATGFELREE
jgi:hypothetical protein